MLRSVEERDRRQDEMRLRQGAIERTGSDLELLSLAEAAALLRVSLRTAGRLLKKEPGVNLIYVPGSRRPIVRVHRSVIERILKRSANPF